MDERAPSVAGEFDADGYEVAAVPVDDDVERVDDVEGAYSRVDERGTGGVAQPEAADEDVDLVRGDGRQTEFGELLLAVGEQAGHQPVARKDDLEDVALADRFQSPSQHDLAEGVSASGPAPRRFDSPRGDCRRWHQDPQCGGRSADTAG